MPNGGGGGGEFAALPVDNNNDDDDDLQLSNHPTNELDDDDDEGDDAYYYSHEQPPSSADTPLGRVGLVLVTYILAIAVPNVECMISLAGALAGSLVALLVPPAMYLTYQKNKTPHLPDDDDDDEDERSTSSSNPPRCLVGSYILVAAGFIFLVIGTTASLVDIVKIYEGQ